VASRKFDLPDMESEIFFAKGLDKKFAKLPVGQITSGKTMQSWLLKPNRRYFRLRRQNLALGKLSKDSESIDARSLALQAPRILLTVRLISRYMLRSMNRSTNRWPIGVSSNTASP
jgi:hypothetical protein